MKTPFVSFDLKNITSEIFELNRTHERRRHVDAN